MTLIHTVLVFVLVAIFAANIVHGGRPLGAVARALTSDSGQAEFDYFMFVRQWPGGYCSAHSCPRLHTHGYQFTIHGLWPNYNNGKWPQFCDADLPFKEAEIDDLSYVMDEEWPSFTGANSIFWSHEWNKHGTCALHVLASEHKYFKTVLKLHYKLDLSAAFHAAGIEPSSSRTFSKDTILDAVDDMYGAEPQLHCASDGTLMEVWMCLDKDLKPFTCRSPQAAPANDYCARVRLPPPPNLDENHGGWLTPKSPDDDGKAPTAVGAHGDDDYDDYTHDDTGGSGRGPKKHRGGDDDYDDYTHDDTGGSGHGPKKHRGGDDDYDDYTHDDTSRYAYAGDGSYSDDSVSIEAYDVEVQQGSVAWTALEGATEAASAEDAAGSTGDIDWQHGDHDDDDDDDEDEGELEYDDDEGDKDGAGGHEEEEEHHHKHGGDADTDDDDDEHEEHHNHHHHHDDDDDEDEDKKDEGSAAEAGGDDPSDDHHGHHHHHDDEEEEDDDDEDRHHQHHHHAHDDDDEHKTAVAYNVVHTVDAGTQTDAEAVAPRQTMHVDWLMLCGCAALLSALVVALMMTVQHAVTRSRALLLLQQQSGGVATGVPMDPEAKALLADSDKGASAAVSGEGVKGSPV